MSGGKVVSVLAILAVLLVLLGVAAFGQPSMSIDTTTGRIMIRASRRQIHEVERAISEFPLEVRQIQIKARLLKLSEDAMREFGIHLERLTGVKVPLGETPGEGTGLKLGEGAIEYTFYRLVAGEEKLEAIIKALVTTGEAEILSAPQVSTLSGQVAGIYVVQDVPYLKGTTVDPETKEKTEEWGYITVGIILQVLPDIVGKDLVQMSIVPMVANYEIKAEFGPEHPVFYREISPTNITVRSGETIVIGGLMREEKWEEVAGLPILSRLPVIGNLFKTRMEKKSKSNLVVTVEPRIITPRELEGRTKKIFAFRYALAEEIAPQISEIITPQGMMEINPKEAPPNSVLVRDNEDQMKVIEDVLTKIGTYPQQRREKIFLLRYSSPEPTKEILLSLLSSRGSIKIDKKTNSLVVEDGAYQVFKIEKAISSVEMSNQIPQKKVFHLKYAEEAEVILLLEKFLSPQGSIQVEEESLVVIDNNWVIQQITGEIKKLDNFETQKKTELSKDLP